MAALALLRAARAALPVPARGYAKKAAPKSKGKVAPKEGLAAPEVCTDPTMLATHAMGVNYFKEGPEVALKPDSEYPDCPFWSDSIWGISQSSSLSSLPLVSSHAGSSRSTLAPPKKLEELDPDSIEYWRRLRKYDTWRRNRLKKGKKL